MTYSVTADKKERINLAPETLVEEVLQNISTLLSNPKFTVPLDRGFGLSARFIDKPIPVARTMIISELLDAIEKYEPRAEIVNVTFEQDAGAGRLVPSVEVKING